MSLPPSSVEDEARALLDKITPGDWQSRHAGVEDGAFHPPHVVTIATDDKGQRVVRYVSIGSGVGCNGDADADFIAAAPRLLRALLVERETRAFRCKANRTADPPQDCDWPCCGCDPYADKVIAALMERGDV